MDKKTCCRCKSEKGIDEFAKSANRKDGVEPYCKACKNRKAREDYAANAEIRKRRAERSKEYLADPENQKRVAEYRRKWYEEKKNDPDFLAKQREQCRRYDRSERGREVRSRNAKSDRAREYQRKYAKEKGIPRAKERYHFDPEFKQKMVESKKKWYCSEKGLAFRNSVTQKEWRRQYSQAKKMERNEWFKQKYNNDPEFHSKVRAKNNTRIERERASGGDLKAKDWLFLVKLSGGKCLSCGKEEKLTMDHIIPIKPGGKTTIENIQPLCNSCNARKGVNFIDYRSDEFIKAVSEYLTCGSK